MTTLTRPAPAAAADTAARFGLWIFLGSELLFFGGLLFAYAVARMHQPAGFALAGRHTDVVLGTINTALLLTSSLAVALAEAWADHDADAPRVASTSGRWAAVLLAVAALLGAAFLLIKGIEYRHEWQEHLFPGPAFALAATPGAQLFFQLYFVMTGLHALHLAIGMAWLLGLAWRCWRRPARVLPRHVAVAALYWHFVDVVWIVLWPLLYLVQRHA
jgi:cytochrome c oxidase subunit 3